METEDTFHACAKRLALQLLKNAQRVPPELLDIVQTWETGEWKGLSGRDKRARLDELSRRVDGRDALTLFFREYPHAWSRNLFAAFLESLEAYRQAVGSAE